MVTSLLFFFLIFLWWKSKSPSFSVILLLCVSILWTMVLSFFFDMKTSLVMFFLTLVGGLFILTSLIVLSFPKDWKVFSKLDMFFSLVISLVFSFFGKKSLQIQSEFMIPDIIESGWYSLTVIFVLLLLLLSLSIIDWFMGKSMNKTFWK